MNKNDLVSASKSHETQDKMHDTKTVAHTGGLTKYEHVVIELMKMHRLQAPNRAAADIAMSAREDADALFLVMANDIKRSDLPDTTNSNKLPPLPPEPVAKVESVLTTQDSTGFETADVKEADQRSENAGVESASIGGEVQT